MNSLFDPIFKMLQKPAKLVTIVTFYIVAAFMLLVNLPDTDGGFFGVIGGLIIMVIMIALFAIVPTLLLLKKEDVAKKVFPFILFYWLLNEVTEFLSHGRWIRPKVTGLYVTIGIFEFLIALAFIAAIVLIVLGMFKKSLDFGNLPYVIAAGTFLFYFIDFILQLVREAKYVKGDWSDYIGIVISYLILPVGIFFAVLLFFPRQKNA